MRFPFVAAFLLFVFFLFGFEHNLLAQDDDDEIDLMVQELKIAKHDTVRCRILFDLAGAADDDEWPAYNDQLKKLCEANLAKLDPKSKEALFYNRYYAEALNNEGYLANQDGDAAEALAYYEKSLAVSEKIGDKEGTATSLNNIGAILYTQGNISRALEYYSRSLKIREEVNDKVGITNSLNNLGIIYNTQGDIPKALEYYTKALKIREEIGDKDGISSSLNNIGNIYDQQGDYEKALDCYRQSLQIKEATKDKRGIALSLNNIGRLYSKKGDFPQALEYLEKGLRMREAISDKSGMTYSLQNIANVYLQQKKYPQAMDYAERSMALSKELGFPENIRNSAELLHKIYTLTGNYKGALENYELFISMRDSIQSTENKKASIKRELQYDYEKKSAEDSVANAKQAEINRAQVQQKEAELKAQRNQQYALYGGLALVLVFAGFMYNRFMVTRKQKNIIELKEKETQFQKHIIEEKHKEITDSINYAERIQRSFLASETLLNDRLGNYFIFFQPKDVVSGDFYWASQLRNGNFAYVTADSTGHGVPGAIMSILNVSSLEKAIEEETTPAGILNETRRLIIDRLKKDGSPEGGKDGMDCSLVVLEKDKKQLSYAAANNPVLIVRGNELLEFFPDKMPVGKHDKDSESFIQHQVDLQPNDMIYTLTDGFADQFGGPKGKKFMYKKLKELLVEVAHLPTTAQKEKLAAAFFEWKNALEQVDDVCLIGVRVG